jgi:hypothetical protein
LRQRSDGGLWFNPNFNHSGCVTTRVILAPGDEPTIGILFSQLQMPLLLSSVRDRVSCLTITSGIPLYAFRKLFEMKIYYEQFVNQPIGAGIHLSSGDGDMDWKTYLPDLIPYSYIKINGLDSSPADAATEEMFNQAIDQGIVQQDPLDDWYLFEFEEPSPWECSLEDLLHGKYDPDDCVRILEYLDEHQKKIRSGDMSIVRNKIPLTRNTTPDGHRICADQFIRAPKLQQLVREEIRKLEDLQRAREYILQVLHQYRRQTM